MDHPICTACGTQYAASVDACPVCDDPRQFVPPGGQQWTTLDALRQSHRNAWRRLEPDLYEIHTVPGFGIGQRALLVRTPAGVLLWDCISLLDDATVDLVRALGGLRAVAISHPHYYTTMVEWARAFDCPVLLHAADRAWVKRPDVSIVHWDGETRALADLGLDGLTLVRCGGHFAGGTVLHWAAGTGGRGALLTGDIIQVVRARGWVSFMRSYPNDVPLDATTVRHIVAAVAPYAYERVYGAFPERQVERDGKAAVVRSADRYLAAIAHQPAAAPSVPSVPQYTRGA